MLIPGPDTRVVELRVHGILGTTAEELVDSVAAVDVAGDGLGRVVRPADRLRRPAPGPVLRAAGRPLPRTLEGYVWGALTSGGLTKAIWALLFPFSLANVASWMLPPVPEGSRVAHLLVAACRAVLRLAALLLTVLLVGQLAAVSLDLLAAQCLAPGSRCLSAITPDWLRTIPVARPVIGLLPMLIVVFVLHRICTVNWAVHAGPDADRPAAEPRKLSRLPGVGRIGDPDAPALRSLHIVAALATLAFMALGGTQGPVGNFAVAICWALAALLIALAAVGALVLGDPTGAWPERHGGWLLTGLSALPRRLLLGASTALVVAVVAVRPRLPGTLPGIDATLNTITIALASACVLLGGLLLPAALLARRRWTDVPGELRPWAGGWLAAPFMALAALLGGGFGAGMGITVRRALGSNLKLPAGYAYLTLLWGIAGALIVLGGLLLGLGAAIRKVLGRGVPVEVPLLHAGRPVDARSAAPAWWWANWERRHAHQMVLGVTAVLAVGALISAVPWLTGVLPPAWSQPLSTVGVFALGALAVVLLRAVYAAARRPNSARHLGGLADLACFWPRESHPVVPPCYALKVVPELAARAAEHLKDPNTRVVIAGHSQGTVIAAAAVTRLLGSLPERDRARLGLVVAGSPLQWAYPRAFPAVVSHDGLLELYTDLDGRWRALSRGTDPIGGGLTTWRRQCFDEQLIGVGFRPDGTAGAVPAATTTASGALILGGDHWLPDPQHGPIAGRRWTPGVRRHDDYYSDPEWDRAIACASGMESPTERSRPSMVFRLPGAGSAAG